MSDLSNLFQNPKSIAVKRFLAEILKQKYLTYEELINRSTFYLVTDQDLTSFGKMINDVYEMGYMKAIDDYKDQLAKLGIKVNINRKT